MQPPPTAAHCFPEQAKQKNIKIVVVYLIVFVKSIRIFAAHCNLFVKKKSASRDEQLSRSSVPRHPTRGVPVSAGLGPRTPHPGTQGPPNVEPPICLTNQTPVLLSSGSRFSGQNCVFSAGQRRKDGRKGFFLSRLHSPTKIGCR